MIQAMFASDKHWKKQILQDLYEHRARLAELVERVDTDNQIGYGPSQNPLGPVYSEKLRAFSLKKTARGIEDFL